MTTQQAPSDIKQENEKLRLENVQLKKSLEREEFLHKALYRQWNELNIRRLAEKRELKLESGNLFYKYVFYFLLFSVIPVYYFLSNRGGGKTAAALETVSSPTPTSAQMPMQNPDTVPQPLSVKFEEKIIQPGNIHPNPGAINKPAIDKAAGDKPISDSVRSSIYWEGWSAYYEKLRNPYQKSLQKSEVWLEGWKQGENDAKKKSAQ